MCVNCDPYYEDMNKMFDKMLNDPLAPQHVCMDIVDMVYLLYIFCSILPKIRNLKEAVIIVSIPLNK